MEMPATDLKLPLKEKNVNPERLATPDFMSKRVDTKNKASKPMEYLDTDRNLLTEEDRSLDLNTSNEGKFSDSQAKSQKKPQKKSALSKGEENEALQKKDSHEEKVEKAHEIIEETEHNELAKLIKNNTEKIETSKSLKFHVKCMDYVRLFLPNFLNPSYSKKDVYEYVSTTI
jgi:hypothetical protein